jgi:PAS domain S-box-containing protein
MRDGRERVLLLTPTGRDAALIAETLLRNEIVSEMCPDADTFTSCLRQDAGAAVVAEEALSSASITAICGALEVQPAWSDLPVLVLSSSETDPVAEHRLRRIEPLGNVTVIERPVRPATLISVVQSALRARRRQYEVESLLTALGVAEERLRSMIESAQDYAIISVDVRGHVTFWNSGARRMLGYLEEAIVGKPFDVLFMEEERQGGAPHRELEEALRTGRAVTEGWRRRRDGSRFWASGVMRPTRNAAGKVAGYVEVLRDMTEQKRVEERLTEQARQLQQSNYELQRFAYVASHDLQEPLRMIASYTQLLVRRNGAALDGDAREYVDIIVSGVERMRTLILDLLEFSRLAAEQTRPAGRVDCNAVFGLALQHLQLAITEQEARITFDRLPVVCAHESRIFQVFQNLLANALKYCETRPQVHVGAVRDGDFWCLSVRDNGIGIAAEYHEKIFGLFQRLHPSAQYPGTGIGLATCKRIVEQYGGKIWVESVEGQGSTFYFTVPAVDGDED